MSKALRTLFLLAGLPALVLPVHSEEAIPSLSNLAISDCVGNFQTGTLTTSTGIVSLRINMQDSGSGLAFGRAPYWNGGVTGLSAIVSLLNLDQAGPGFTDLSGSSNGGNDGGTTTALAASPETAFNNARTFAQAADAITIAVSPTMNSTTDQLTLSGWINPTAVGSQPIFSYDSGGGQGVHFWIGPPGGGGAGDLYANFVDSQAVSHILRGPAGSVSAGSWQHVATTYNGSIGRLYHNGVQVASAAIGSLPPLQTGLIGNWGSAPSVAGTFLGGLDDVFIASRALSSLAMRNIWHSGNIRFSSQSVLGPFFAIELSTNAGGHYTPTSPTQGTTATTTATVTGLNMIDGGSAAAEFSVRDRGGATSAITFNIGSVVSLPTQPLSIVATPLSATQIRWDWSPPTRLCLTNAATPGTYNAYDENSVLLQGGIVEPTRTHTEAGFNPNTLHGARISSQDDYGESSLTSQVYAYTFANPPLMTSVTAISSGSFIINYNQNSNPAYTRYEMVLFSDDTFTVGISTPILITDNHTSAAAALTGLTPSTTYYIGIRAKSGQVGDGGLGQSFSTFLTTTVPTLPVAPGTLSATPLSNTALRWNWVAVPSAQSYRLENGAGGLLSFGGATSFVQTPLTTNTQYSARLQVNNASGQSPFSGTLFAFTLANAPTATAITGFSTGTISLSWNANGNPAGTSYQIQVASDNAFGGTVNSAATSNTATSLLGLLPGTTHYIRVRALNGNAVATTFDTTVNAVTNILAPTSSAPTPPTTYTPAPNTALLLQFDASSGTLVTDFSGNSNNGTMSCTFFLCSTPTFTTGNIGMGNAGSFTGIQNTLCRVPHAASLNTTGDLTVETWVKPNTQLQTPQAGIITKGSGTFESYSLDVLNTRYRFFVRNAGFAAQFAVSSTQTIDTGRWTHVAGVYDSVTPALSIYIDGVLSSSTTAAPGARGIDTHELSIGSRQSASADYNLGFQGAIDAVQVINFARTPAQIALDYQSGLASTLTLPSPNDDTSLVIPPDAFGGDATIIVSSFPIGSPLSVDPAILAEGLNNPPTGLALIPGSVTEVIAQQGAFPFVGNFNSSVTVTLGYTDNDNNTLVDGTNPPVPVSGLRMYTLNTAVVRWEPLPTFVDTSNKTVTGLTEHFSIFALFGPSGVQADVSNVRAYPVPWLPGSGGRFDSVTFQGVTGIAFDNLTTSGEIRIYTLSGELVTTLRYSSFNAGTIIWNGRNSAGRNVASGVYFAYIKPESGATQLLKLAVEK
jgi:hypothetical protein